ncbi:MAG TPA: DMT family transporter [Macromonas sp.]|nr:DMT family transporter [Macromonas sp.]
MAVLLALIAAAAYGFGDFLGGLAARRYTPLQVMALAYPASTLIVLCAMPFFAQHFSLVGLVFSTGSGLALVVAIWCLYSALAIGPISIVSPITGLLSAGLPVVAGLLLGETLAATGWAGVLLGMAAIGLVSLHGHAGDGAPHGAKPVRFAGRVVWMTLLTGIGFALSYVLTHAIPAEAGLWPVLVARLVGWASILLIGGWRLCRHVDRTLLCYGVLIGALDAVASTAMYYALQAAQLSTTTVLISLYPVFTILLALGVLRERLVWQQGVGIALSVLAVALMSL